MFLSLVFIVRGTIIESHTHTTGLNIMELSNESLYLDFLNNFLTVKAFANAYNMTIDQARQIIDEGRVEHAALVYQYQVDCVSESLSDIVDEVREYLETDEDHGGNYAHMPQESWSGTERDMLIRFMDEEGVDGCGLDIEEIEDIVLDSLEMVPMIEYDTVPRDLFVPFAYPVGEIEHQFSISDLGGFSFEITQDLLDEAIEQGRHYVRGGPDNRDNTHCLHNEYIIYITSDVVWSAQVPADVLADQIRGYALANNGVR